MEIKDKVALVSGGSRGIGRAVARALAQKGAKVVLHHFACRVDLRDKNIVQDFINEVKEKYGALHILVNNIERGGMPVVHGSYDLEANKEQWDLEMETTLKAKWLLVHHALPLLKKAAEGVIINISSIAGIIGRSGPAGMIFNDGYSAANRAVSSLTQTWAREGAPSVRVNELMLGFVETRHGEGTKGWEILSENDKQAIMDHTLLKRTGKLDDVVRAVLFLIREAVFMTGAVLRLDGGYVLGGEKVPAMPQGILDSPDRSGN